ncbi:MAG: carbohydrate kinase, partial [Defluviitaleaceae bacterium]|nr:carbohydrate kinase [Defluviitaleaceae bacterium]
MTATDYFLGVDDGGTMVKAVVFDECGNEAGGASRELEMETPGPGFTERCMDYLWAETAATIREAVGASGIDPKQIKGVACTGHGKGLYLWGKNGRPVRNGIVSTDSRAWEYPKRWKADGTADRVFEKTYQTILASQPVSLLRWLKDNEPAALRGARWIFECKDYVRFMLTGEAYAEVTDYSGSNLLNLRDRRFDAELLAEYGLEDLLHALPPLKNSSEACGRVTKEAALLTGLTEGCAVAGGMFDIDACAVAMDITSEENIAVIAGTWSINEYISKTPVLDKSVMMNSLYAIDGYYLIEECSPTSAGNFKWFADMFLESEKAEAARKSKNFYAHLDSLAQSTPPCGTDIFFLPHIYGSNYNPQAKAAIIGLDGSQTRPQIVRAALEGVAYCHRVHIDRLLANRRSTKAIRLAGGAAKSGVWAKIFADATGIPIERVDADELGTLGSAMAAAVASGKYANLAEAAKRMVKIKDRTEPDPALTALYNMKFQKYKRFAEALDPL